MTTCQDLLDDLNDRLNDAGNTQIPQATKIRYLNRGIAATWPHLYVVERDDTLYVQSGVYEYNLLPAVEGNTRIIRVEVEANSRFVQISDWEISPGTTDRTLHFPNALPGLPDARIRITAARPLALFTLTTDTYEGPLLTDELPVLYAMGIAASRRVDDRLDHRRYSTTAAQNGVDIAELMTASQYWFSQFELLLDRFSVPMPTPEVG